MRSFNWIVSQIGARQHYAMPRALDVEDELYSFYTDAWAASEAARTLLRQGTSQMRSFAKRHHALLPDHKVTAFNASTIRRRIQRAFSASENSMKDKYYRYVRDGKQFANSVTRDLRKQNIGGDELAFLGVCTGCLETIQFLNDRVALTIVDQIDPARVELEIIREEAERWPSWTDEMPAIPSAYFDRLQSEWMEAGLVLVNSKWSKDALIKQGVPREKIIVVPQAYEGPGRTSPPPLKAEGNLEVLWLGSVILRKGIPYLVNAARQLQAEPINFTIAGPIGISETAIAEAPDNISFVGRLTRDQVSAAYRQADVFVLPTLSDGFAITQLEAMAHGLPVIATPRCGDVVTNDKDGFLIAPRSVDDIISSLTVLATDRTRLQEMSRHALTKTKQFTLEEYRNRLLSHL